MNPEATRVVCIGGATVDRKYRASDAIQMKTSNPATAERSFGGVARNVAEAIARLGAPSGLLSVVGDDENGRAIRAELVGLNVDVRHLAISNHHATAEYVAVLGPDGDLALGLADMAIFDALTPSHLHRAWAETSPSWIFADCNLPSPTLDALIGLARQQGPMLAIDAVSAVKVRRLPRDLTGVGLLFLNIDEARALLDAPRASPTAAAAALLARGPERVVLTLGADGLIAAECGRQMRVAAVPARVVDATGAGDALIATTLVALREGRSLAAAVRMGTVAAALTLECPASVRPDLSLARLESAATANACLTTEGEFP